MVRKRSTVRFRNGARGLPDHGDSGRGTSSPAWWESRHHAVMAQLVARLLAKEKVAGSSPVSRSQKVSGEVPAPDQMLPGCKVRAAFSLTRM
jgi:hypothetical protein